MANTILTTTFSFFGSKFAFVATLALGSRPRQGLARAWAKKESRDCGRVWEWTLTLPSEFPFWELEFWWTSKSSECDCKGQNSLHWRFPYIIGKILERRCLKWAHMTNLDIWNTSYGQKKGLESNWQFDSQSLKVRNRPIFLAWRWCATYHCKDLDKGYNFDSDLILIGGLYTKLWGPKVAGVSILGIFPRKKAIWMWASRRGAKYTIRGKVMASPKSGPWWVLWVRICPWFILAPKMFPQGTNQFVVWFWCKFVWVSKGLSFFLVPSRMSNTPFYPRKCYEPRSVPQLRTFSLFLL
jgi:hypothetical protein